MRNSMRARRVTAVALALALIVPSVTSVAVDGFTAPQLVKNAACKHQGEAEDEQVKCDTPGPLQTFVNAADELVSPGVIAMIAVAPIACLVGAGAIMFGSRRGMVIIGSALGALVFMVSVKGIVK